MVDQPVKHVVEEINSAYMSYLAQLKERNKQKQIMHKKSEELMKRERLEQGFKLYFNILNNENLNLKQPTSNYRSRSANLSTKQGFHRTKSAPNLPKQRPIRKAWGEFTGLESNCKTVGTTSWIRNSPIESNSDKCTVESSSDSKYVPNQFPYPSTKNMHCKPRKWPTDSLLVDNDNSTCSVKQIFPDKLEWMNEIFGLELDIYSNWGDPNWVGLSGLELDDPDLAKIIRFQISDIFKLNWDGIQTNRVQLFHEENLFKAPFQTSDPNHMCFTSIDNLPLRMNIKCLMNSDGRINRDSIILRLWNYNDPKFPNIGVRDCSLKLRSNNKVTILFNGIIDRSSEDESVDVPKMIDCNLKNNAIGLMTLSSREYSEVAQTTQDRYINPANEWSAKADDGNWQYLRRVDPSLSDTMGEFRLNSSPEATTDTMKHDDSQIRSVLEESWNSLKFFNHFHAGRISSERENSIKRWISFNEHPLSDEVATELHTSTQWIPDLYYDVQLGSKESKPNSNLCLSDLCSNQKTKQDKMLCPERSSEPIQIPVLPFGHRLIIDIISTWGDIYYVGLTGIEIFTADGINVAPFCQICADPADINILPGYNEDPRVITNLIDGVNWTRDDIHMWLAPFSVGARHFIEICLPPWTKPIALIRIWNYNKSRVHASRGAREIIIYLDSIPIFHGEISKASGLELGDPEDFSETILFCTDNHILEQIGKNDEILKLRNSVLHDIESTHSHLDERPKTSVEQEFKQLTNGNSPKLSNSNDLITKLFDNLDIQDQLWTEDLWIEIELVKPWNQNLPFIGLTGIQIFNSTMEWAKVKHVTLNGKSVHSTSTVQKLFNQTLNTCNPDNMWHVEWNESKPPKLRIHATFNSKSNDHEIAGLKIWNYNNPHHETDYSCKLIRIQDYQGQIWTQNSDCDLILLRRGPGHTKFAFGQTILSNKRRNQTSSLDDVSKFQSDFRLPNGFVYQLNIFSSWYDQFYVGLDGLELIGSNGLPIEINKNQIFASPSSVNELMNSHSNRLDIRTIDKLIDGINQGSDMNYHCWLAPILPNQINQIFIVFDEPIHAIGLRLWNYTRTPERGVRELAVLLDDRLLFRGYLPKYQRRISLDQNVHSCLVQGILPNCEKRSDEETNHYYVVPLSQEDVKKLEDSKYIMDNSNIQLADPGVKLINIDSTRCENVWRTTESNLRQRSNINQTLRPTTCISSQPIRTKM